MPGKLHQTAFVVAGEAAFANSSAIVFGTGVILRDAGDVLIC